MERRFELLRDISSIDLEAQSGCIGVLDSIGNVWFDNRRFYFKLKTCLDNFKWFREITEQPKEEWKWTDELVSEYLTSIMTSNHPYLYKLEHWKKFKQSDNRFILDEIGKTEPMKPPTAPTDDKDCEIVKFNSIYENYHKVREEIISVRRKSDNQVFSVGDEVTDGNFSFKIHKLEISGNGIMARCDNIIVNILYLNKTPQQKSSQKIGLHKCKYCGIDCFGSDEGCYKNPKNKFQESSQKEKPTIESQLDDAFNMGVDSCKRILQNYWLVLKGYSPMRENIENMIQEIEKLKK